MNLAKAKQIVLVGLLALAIMTLSSARGSTSQLNLEEINNLEYPFILYSLGKRGRITEKIKFQNGRIFRTGDYLDARIKEVVFHDLDNDGTEEAIVVYHYHHSFLQMVEGMFCVVINKNGHPQIADFKHFHGGIELRVKENIINIIVRHISKLPNEVLYKEEFNYSFQGEKLVEK